MWDRIVFVLLLFLPFQFATNFLAGNDVAVFRMLIPGVFFIGLLDLFRRKRDIFFDSGFLIWLCMALFSIVCGIIAAPHLDWAMRKAFFLGEFVLWLFLLAILVFNGLLAKKTIVFALIYSGTALAISGIAQWSAQFLFGLEPMLSFWQGRVSPFFLGSVFSETVATYSSWLVNVGGTTLFRAIGVFPDPHTYAFFLELCFPWTVFLFFKTKQWQHLLLSMLILLGLVLSFSRGAYIGLFAAGFVFLLFFQKFLGLSKRKGLFLITILTVFALLFLGTENFVQDRLKDTFLRTDSSGEERIVLWKEALLVISENPIFGVGFAGFPERVQPSAQYRDPIYAHNLYLDIATETGLLGVLVFMWGIVWAAFRFLTLGRKDCVYYGGFFALICFGAHGMFDTPIYSVQSMGILCAMLVLGFRSNSKK